MLRKNLVRLEKGRDLMKNLRKVFQTAGVVNFLTCLKCSPTCFTKLLASLLEISPFPCVITLLVREVGKLAEVKCRLFL